MLMHFLDLKQYFNNGIIYKLYEKTHKFKVYILWKSQQKMFAKIGEESVVIEIPSIIGYEHISIGDNFFCGKDVRIEAWSSYKLQSFSPEIIIGNDVTFTDRCYLSCVNRIEIGNGVLFGRNVFVTDNSHGSSNKSDVMPKKRCLTSKGAVVIEDNVWVGREVTILAGISIGKNSVIGANSVVTHDIPSNCVAVGSPAKIIKEIN